MNFDLVRIPLLAISPAQKFSIVFLCWLCLSFVKTDSLSVCVYIYLCTHCQTPAAEVSGIPTLLHSTVIARFTEKPQVGDACIQFLLAQT